MARAISLRRMAGVLARMRGEVDSQQVEPVVFLSSNLINDAACCAPVPLEDRIVHVWGFSLDQGDATIAMCRQWLSVEEQARAGRFIRMEDGARYILARGCLRRLLARYTGLEPAALSFELGGTGKPALASTAHGETHIHFNLSHSHGRMLIAVAKQREVGVDLERIRDQVEVGKLAQRFYSPSEREGLTGLPGPAQAARFFRYWAAKEAFLKCKGVGLQFPLERCEIALLPDSPAASVNWKAAPGSLEQGMVRFLPLEDGWVGAVTAEGEEWRTETRR